jgi:CBS domain-containing protein
MSIADILRDKGHEVVKLRMSDTVQTAVRKLAEHRIGALVVEDAKMHVAGVFSERDFVEAVSREGAKALDRTVDTLMSTPVISCRSADRIEAVMATMTKARIRHMPVIEDGHMVGIVSIGDLVKHRLDEKALEANVLLDLTRMRA